MRVYDILTYRKPLFESRQAVEFVSGPGAGKSVTVRETARVLSRDYGEPVGLVTKILSGIEATDVKGFLMPVVQDDVLLARFSRPPVFPDKWNCEVFENGELVTDPQRLKDIGIPQIGIVFLDEYGQADADVQKVSAEFLLSKCINENRLGPRWTVWAASNRVEDKSGVVKRLAFVDNRMMSLPVFPDADGFEKYGLRHGLHPLAITFARRNPSIVFKDKVPDKGGKFCTPRSTTLCTELLERLRPANMPLSQLPSDGFALECMIGWMGDGDAAVYAEHLALGAQLPDPEEVWADPKGTKVPDRIDAKFVMASNMALVLTRHKGSSASDARVGATLTYIERFEEELQVVFIQSLMGRAPQVMRTPQFGEWATRNQKLIMAAYAV